MRLREMRFRDEMRVNERASGIFLINSRNKIMFFFLALMNSAHLSIDVHCSSGGKKK